MSEPPVKDYAPYSWVSLAHVKKEHYRALAHFYVAVGLVDHTGDFSAKTIETLQFLHEEAEDKASTLIEIRVPKHANEKRYLGTLIFFYSCSRKYNVIFQNIWSKMNNSTSNCTICR